MNQQGNSMSMQGSQKKQNDKRSKSLALDLESLNAEYKNLLVSYKQAVLDYVDNLKKEASKPCAKYNKDSKNIDQTCYEEIWKKSGCTTTGFVKAGGDWSKERTLNELIRDSFYWATFTTENHRMGCYGIYESPYLIICVGQSGRLYVRNGLEGTWSMINDDAANDLVSVCTSNNGKTLIASTKSNRMFTKPSFDSTKWQPVRNSNCCVISVAMGEDGTLVGVGTDNKLWSKPSLEGNWTQTASPGEWCVSVAIAPDGSLFVIGGGNQIWKKNSYKNLPSQQWQGQGSCCVRAITIAPDGTFIGVGTDNQLYIKDSYKNLSTNWKGPYKNSCCAIGITTIANPKYTASNIKYSTATSPNFNINAPEYAQIKGQAFWGTGSVGQTTNGTLQDCVASCGSTNGCTGATYNSKNVCMLRSGAGLAVPSNRRDVAIVPKSQQLLQIVTSVNNQLTSVNNKIQDRIRKMKNIYGDQMQMRNIQNYDLISQHEVLQTEREKIKTIVDETQKLENIQDEADIFTTKNYYIFYILSAIVIVSIVILGISSTDQSTSNAINAAVVQPTITIVKKVQSIDPYYTMFAFILVFVVVYIYNQYFASIYKNLPSFQKMGQLGFIYVIFAIVLIYIAFTYFSKRSGGLPSLPSMPAMPGMPTFK